MKNKFLLSLMLLSCISLTSCSLEDLQGPVGPKGEAGQQGEKGEPGKDGVGIIGIEKTDTKDNVDTYTITYTDGKTSNFAIVNGVNGEQGIQGIKGEDGHSPVISIGESENWLVDGADTGIQAQGPKGDKGDKGDTGENGKSAYELYLESHPDYKKTEAEWLDDLVNDRLATKITYTVSFDTGTSETIPEQKIEHGAKITKPNDPINPGYTFQGWEYKGEIWSFVGHVVTEDMLLTAKWSLNDYKVTINYNNDQSSESRIYHYNDTLSLENPTKVDYKFLNWEDESHNIITFPYTITSDVTLNAVYTNEVIAHFDSNGGTAIEDQTFIINGTINSLPVPTHSSGKFIGWFYENNGTATEYKAPFKNIFTDDFTLKAHWQLTAKDYEYEVMPDGNVKLLSYTGTDNNVLVPSLIDDKAVTTLGASTFKENNSITSVTLPDSIRILEDDSFLNCTSLASIEFGDWISNYGQRILIGCTSLKTITIPNNVKLIQLYDYDYQKIPFALSKIRIKNIEEVIQSDAITTKLFSNLGNRLFTAEILNGFNSANGLKGCVNIVSVIIDEGVQSIGRKAFCDCINLTTIDISDSVSSIGNYAFYRCKNLVSIDLPSGLTTIEAYTFDDCESLESIVIPDSVTSIKERAFMYCKNLELVVLSESLTTIADEGFSYCDKLNTIVLPKSLIDIGERAFEGDSELSDAYYGGTEAEFNNINIGLNNRDFYYANFHYDTALNKSNLITDSNFKYFKTNKNEIIVLKFLKTKTETIDLSTYFEGLKIIGIGSNCFANNINLKSIKLPETVLNIGSSAFYNCTNLASIVIPNKVTRINSNTFYHCRDLVSIVLPKSIKIIEDRAFYGCDSLRDVYYLGTKAEYGQINLSLGNNSFTRATTHYESKVNDIVLFEDSNLRYLKNNLNEISILECLDKNISSLNLSAYFGISKVLNIEDNAFQNCTKLTSIVLPDTITYIGEAAFMGCSELNSINIPNSVIRISDYTFKDCTNLQNVILPNTLESIGDYAFSNCSSLTSIVIPISVTSLGSNVFEHCASSACIYIEAANKPEGWSNSWVFSFYGQIQWGYVAA